eukprot:1195026-Prorocentrum_minimum.AAC.3
MARHFQEEHFYSLPKEGRARLLACCRLGLENPDATGAGVTLPGGSKDYQSFKPFVDAVRIK